MSNTITGFTMPKWGIEMEEGVIREWFADEGAAMSPGDLLVSIETDKIANDVELEFAGSLRKRVGEEGETYPVGALIAVFANGDVPDADIDRFVAEFKPADASFSDDDDADADAAPVRSEAPAAPPPNLSISPKAAELATSLGVDLTEVKGSGRKGRISLQDVQHAARAQGLSVEPAAAPDNPYKEVKLSAMRRTIAKRLADVAQSVPHFYLRNTIVMDPLLAVREAAKASGPAPSVNDYLIKACAKSLMEVPDINVQFHGDVIHQFEHADISVAVAVPGGLVTPVVRLADQKTLADISREMRELGEAARAETLTQEQYRGGGFSLSNLGMYGVTSFDAVVNPPMAAILAVGAVERAPKEEGGFQSVMQVTLSCDHRAVDGAMGARFLQALKAALEQPDQL